MSSNHILNSTEPLEVDTEGNIGVASLADEQRRYGLLHGDTAITRLQLQHRIWQLSFPESLALAPLPTPDSGRVKDVIDIGCGTGAWAIDFATAYPTAQVLGVDLKALQPSAHPSNVRFIIDDVMKETSWINPADTTTTAAENTDQQFDYVHSRSIASGISSWPDLVCLAWKNLRPGGWVEFQEFHLPMRCDDGSMAGTKFEEWNKLLVEASNRAGRKLDGGFAQVPDLLREKGFVGAGRAGTKWPVGPWPKEEQMKELGRMFRADLSVVLEGVSVGLFTKVLGWEREVVLKLWVEVAAEMEQVKMHAYVPIDIVWAQKPGDTVG